MSSVAGAPANCRGRTTAALLHALKRVLRASGHRTSPLEARDLRDRNEPGFLPWILDAVADACQRPRDEVAAATTANARRCFGMAP